VLKLTDGLSCMTRVYTAEQFSRVVDIAAVDTWTLYVVAEIKSASHQDLSRLASAASFYSESDDDENLSRHASPAPSHSTSKEGQSCTSRPH